MTTPTPHPAADGLRKFIRSLGLTMESYQLRQVSDEFDLIDALSSVKYFFHSSVELHGSLTPAAMEDVRKDMEEYLLKGINAQENTLKWSRNAPMYVLVIKPTIDLLANLKSYSAKKADNIVNTVISMVRNADESMYGDHDDAVVAREQIRHIIADYRALHLTPSPKKKAGRPKKKMSFLDYSEQEDEPRDHYSEDEVIESLDFN